MAGIREIYCSLPGPGSWPGEVVLRRPIRKSIGTRNPVFGPLSFALRPSAQGTRALRGMMVLWYIGTMSGDGQFLVERVQTGVRIEKRLLKVLKAFAEYHDLTLGDLLEGIVLHAFDGKTPFSQKSIERIKELKRFYGLELDSHASHRLKEAKLEPVRRTRKPKS